MSEESLYRVLFNVYLVMYLLLISYNLFILKNRNEKIHFLNILNIMSISLFILGYRIYMLENLYIKNYLYEFYLAIEQFVVSTFYMLILKVCKPYLKVDWKYKLYVYMYPIITIVCVIIMIVNNYFINSSLFSNNSFFLSLFYENTLLYTSAFFIVAVVLIMIKLLLDKISVSTTYKSYYISLLVLALGTVAYKFYEVGKILSSLDLIFFNATITILTNFVILRYISEAQLVLSRERVFNKLSTAYVIVDSNGNIVDYNTSFEKSLLLFVDKQYRYNLNDVLGEFKFEKSFKNSKEYENDVILIKEVEGITNYYVMISTNLGEKKGEIVGKLIEFVEITDRIELIKKQNDLLNLDELTGLYSRRYYYNNIESYNKKEFLPLGFFSFDINNLKVINDTYGHKFGDKYLITNSRAVKEQILPEKAMSARVGGDEIIAIIPNCTETVINKIIENLERKTTESAINPYSKVNVSMGYSLKTDLSQKSSDVLAIADKNMYKYKQKNKKGRV